MYLPKVWTAALFIGLVFYLVLPVRSSAIDDPQRTSPTAELQPSSAPSETVAAASPEPLPISGNASNPVVESPPKQETSQSVPSTTTAPSPKDATKPGSSVLDSAVEQWKKSLAMEQGFESWQHATWESYPLGPGTHGWLILLYKDGQEVGYMIVHTASDNTLRLTEYGNGPKPLFSLVTLYRTLVQQELIPSTTTFEAFKEDTQLIQARWYLDALHAVWNISIQASTYFIDAKTGELLPIQELDSSVTSTTEQIGKSLIEVKEQLLLPSFDPYDRLPWVTGEPLAVTSFQEWTTDLQKYPQLTYVTELYDGQVTVPLAVLGYQQWGEDQPYLVVDQDGARYIPFSVAVAQGNFYP